MMSHLGCIPMAPYAFMNTVRRLVALRRCMFRSVTTNKKTDKDEDVPWLHTTSDSTSLNVSPKSKAGAQMIVDEASAVWRAEVIKEAWCSSMWQQSRLDSAMRGIQKVWHRFWRNYANSSGTWAYLFLEWYFQACRRFYIRRLGLTLL